VEINKATKQPHMSLKKNSHICLVTGSKIRRKILVGENISEGTKYDFFSED